MRTKITNTKLALRSVVKKSLFDVDNLTDYQRKRYELLTNIQKMVASDFSDKDIALALGISSRTVRRNKHCDPKRCCCLENVSTCLLYTSDAADEL